MSENTPDPWLLTHCVRCQSTHVVPGYGQEHFVVCSSVAERPSWLKSVHDVQLEEIAWLCLDCGTVCQQAVPESLVQLRSGLRDKCDPEHRKQLFDT